MYVYMYIYIYRDYTGVVFTYSLLPTSKRRVAGMSAVRESSCFIALERPQSVLVLTVLRNWESDSLRGNRERLQEVALRFEIAPRSETL